MTNAIPFSLDAEGDHLVEPPIVDAMNIDRTRGAWVVTFVPEDSVSSREKETVTIPIASADGRRISLRLARLNTLLGMTIERLVHSGDGNFAFHSVDGRVLELAGPHGHVDLSMRSYVELSDIAMTAQIAFVGTLHVTQAS